MLLGIFASSKSPRIRDAADMLMHQASAWGVCLTAELGGRRIERQFGFYCQDQATSNCILLWRTN